MSSKKKKYKAVKAYYQVCPKCIGIGKVNIYCDLCKGQGHIYHPSELKLKP